jgi:hypothetical protein
LSMRDFPTGLYAWSSPVNVFDAPEASASCASFIQ